MSSSSSSTVRRLPWHNGRGVCICVSGSVAAVKVPKIVVELLYLGFDIYVVVTDAAYKLLQTSYHGRIPWEDLETELPSQVNDFVDQHSDARSPRLLVYRDSDEWERYSTVGDDEILHIELVKRNHLLLLAPLGANTLAKAALGLCDNLLTAVLRAWPYDLSDPEPPPAGAFLPERARQLEPLPLVAAPAMNTVMWRQRITGTHIRTLEERGVRIVPPVSKLLACGDEGVGAMAEVDTIVNVVASYFESVLPPPDADSLGLSSLYN